MFDTHEDLLVCRHINGVQLVKPNCRQESISQQSISNLYKLSTPVFFMGHEDTVVGGNEASAELVGVSSTRNLPGKTLRDFYDRKTEQMLSIHNNDIMRSKSMKVLEEEGMRVDEMPFHYIAFKFPVYVERNIVGLMGCCIKIDPISVHDFGQVFTALMSTGLLNTMQSPIKISNGIYFSPREKEVLTQLIRGKTAKQIGERLNLSRRTVESYIENMKIKASCSSKSELIDKFF